MPWTTFTTEIGTCGIAWSDDGITFFQLPEESVEATEKRLAKRAGERGDEAPAFARDAIVLAKKHLGGAPQDFTSVPLDLAHVSSFDADVYRALVKVPSGSTISYGDLAKVVGKPGAARAVGRAMGANPIPLIVPCHRVLAAGGKAGGFSAYGGLVTKDRLLTIEGAKKQASLFAAR